ncbi:MAG: DUF6265 family protein [Pseudomonadota bacterium]|nr:DUF6265 family protein [Pseudomonadota bacterium]
MTSIVLGAGLALATALVPQPAAASDDLAWLAGQWCGTAGSLEVEEAWLPERDGHLHGVGRALKDGKVVSFEFMRIDKDDAGVPTYHAQPGGNPQTAFKRTDGGEDWVRFENPENDFPHRVEYRRTDENSMRAEISGPGDDGKTMTIPFEFRRCER